MQIVIAPDSFKESLCAHDVALAIAAGVKRVYPDAMLHCLPIADGGEGTTDALVKATAGQQQRTAALDALGRPTVAAWGQLGDGVTAVIEVAAASGLAQLGTAERNPLLADSRGTGMLIKAALERGHRELILGLGGSATNDGGAGLLHALGARFFDISGEALPPTPAALARVARIDLENLDTRLRHCRIRIACDVTHPLLGGQGATTTFGPQKGATPAQLAELEHILTRYAALVCEATDTDHRNTAGAGAAGGIGFALMSVLGAQPESGIALVLDAIGLDGHLRHADLLITGEGRIDAQTERGKAPSGVALRARHYGVPVIALAGAIPASSPPADSPFDAWFSILPALMPLPEAMATATTHLTRTSEQIMRVWQLGHRCRAPNNND